MDQHETISLDELRKGLTAYHDSFDEHSDSYINMATGLGLPGTSKSEASYFGRERLLQPTELQNLYLSNAYATRIVDRMVDDATRVEWTLTGVDKRFDWSSVKSQLDDLGALMLIGDAWRWARLFGGGLVVMAVDDGQPYDKPLDLNAARRVRGLTTVDSSCVLVQGYVAGVGSVAWSQPSGYQVISPWVFGAGGTGQLAASNKPIHPSRVIRFDGCRVPAGLMVNNGGWSPSVLQRCKKQLDAYGSAYAYAQEILHDLSVMLVKLTGFQEMLLGDNGVADAREMLRQLRWGIDNLNLLVIDKDASEYQEIKRSVEGLEKMLAAFERDLVGASGMTRLILVGEQASGLGASSSDEVRAWYDSVGKEQKFSVTPAINRLLEVIFACRRNSGEQVPTEWEIKYAPLWTPEPKARAEIAQLWMTTASTGIMSGMLTPDEGKAMLVYNGVLEDLPEASTAVGAAPEPDNLENVVPIEGAEEPAANGPPAEPEAAPVAEQALNGAQVQSLVEILAQVSAGTLAPLAAEWVIGQAVPSAVSSPARLAQTKAAVQAAAAQKAASVPADPGTAPAPTAVVEPTDEDEPEDEDHPVDVAWSNDPLPADAMTAKEIAVTLGVKTGRVTRLVREGRLRQWNVLGKKVISLRDVRAIILEDNQATDGRKLDWSDRSLSIVLTLPPELARWVPFKAEDKSAPHVTLIYAKEAGPDEVDELRTFVSLYAATLSPFECELGPVDYFDNETRVAYASIRTPLEDLHAALMSAAKRAGIDVSERDEYVPHCTLAYLPPGEEYDGPIPTGSWTVAALDVCYGATVDSFPLAQAEAE